ncbi:MAG: hypothetical protein ACR2JS_07770 [Candidatus Nanopelagicales bacterium]
MKRALLIALAVVIVIAGVVLLAISAWIYAAFGNDGVATASLGRIASAPSSSAIVIDVDAARVRLPVLPVHGSTTLHLEAVNGEQILAGSHDAASVDAFIGTRDIDVAYRSHGTWSLAHVPGVTAAEPWNSPPAWLTQGSAIEIGVSDDQTVAIANASGATGVNVDAALRYSAPRAPQAALVLSVSAAVLMLAGLALAFSAIRLMRRRPDDLST